MLALAALAALTEAGDTTFCTDDNDLQPEIMPTGTYFGGGDRTCSQINNDALQEFNKESWSDVTCDVARAAGYDPGNRVTYGGPLLKMVQQATPCCGGRSKVKCFDGTNMCRVDADFQAAKPISGEETCQQQADEILFRYASNVTSWANISCDYILTAGK